MWAYIANTASHILLRGCRTLILPIFLGAYLVSRAAATAGFPVAAPKDLYNDASSNFLNTTIASQSLSLDDPFCLWISYPDVAPTSDVVSWVHTAAVDHVSAGQIAVLDRRWQLAFERHSISDQLEFTNTPWLRKEKSSHLLGHAFMVRIQVNC